MVLADAGAGVLRLMDGSTKARAQRLGSPLMDFCVARSLVLEACGPVAPVRVALAQARGGWAAEDVAAPAPLPPCDVALRDGFAMASADLVGASSFSPALLLRAPQRLNAGEPLPEGCDAVVALESVSRDGPPWEAAEPASPGEGVRRAGEDAGAGAVLLHEGRWFDPLALAALREAGIASVNLRQPRIGLVVAPGADRAGTLAGDLLTTLGAIVDVRDALDAGGCDLLLAVGGAGEGVGDDMAAQMRDAGELFAHGLALEPGRAGAVGRVGSAPAVLLPGR
ncbi:MAG: hypothetical protein JWN93_3729, partial [Hyphomicrobiales bacterium]|nr:hypothetical protein [Hyphomicrobiales bacterium]